MGAPSSTLDLTGVKRSQLPSQMSISFLGIEQPDWDWVLHSVRESYRPKTAVAWDPRNERVMKYMRVEPGDSFNHRIVKWNYDHTLSVDGMAELATWWVPGTFELTVFYARRSVILSGCNAEWIVSISILPDVVACEAASAHGSSKKFEIKREAWTSDSSHEPWTLEPKVADSLTVDQYHSLLSTAMNFLGYALVC